MDFDSTELNDITLGGKLVGNPMLRYSSKGNPYCIFRIHAFNRTKDGGRTNNVWIQCVAFGQTAEKIGNMVSGETIVIHGALENDSYEKNGTTYKTYKVIVNDAITNRVDEVVEKVNEYDYTFDADDGKPIGDLVDIPF